MSLLYMAYQLLLFCSSLLTPATIFLLITGALNTAFPAFDLMKSLLVNAIPIGLFLLSCFFLESKWQVRKRWKSYNMSLTKTTVSALEFTLR